MPHDVADFIIFHRDGMKFEALIILIVRGLVGTGMRRFDRYDEGKSTRAQGDALYGKSIHSGVDV
jgi:hypothetical protein